MQLLLQKCTRRTTTCVGLLMVSMAASGCHVRQAVPFRDVAPPGVTVPARVRVTQTNGERLYLESTVISGDSIAGRRRITGGAAAFERIALPLTSVAAVEEERVSTSRTLLFVAALAVAASIVSFMIYGLDFSGVTAY